MPKATRAPFKHEPLDQTRPSIRLVRILPSKQHDSIRCEMIHTTTSAEYTCLSYVWGMDNSDREISINHGSFLVRANLHAFLHVARTRYSKDLLWIDALCIDQVNTAERNHQVQQMGEIYSGASMVIAWLGDGATVEVGLASLRVAARRWPILTISRRLRSLATKSNDADQKDFLDALKEYWGRAWITQEIALATRVKFLARDTEWDLSAASSVKLHRACAHLHRKSFNDPTISQVISIATAQYDSGGKSLLGLLSRFHDRQCSVRRDRIYSLLSLCSEGSRLNVDYGISELELLCRVLDAVRTSCLCSAAIVIGALDLTALRSCDLTKEFAEFEIRGVHVKSPFWLSDSIRCDLCWTDLGSSWHGNRIVSFCLNLVCHIVSGHLVWEQTIPSKNPVGAANLGRLYYIGVSIVPERAQPVKLLGQVGEMMQIASSADSQSYTIRLTLGALLEMLVSSYESVQRSIPCELSFRKYGRRMWCYETSNP